MSEEEINTDAFATVMDGEASTSSTSSTEQHAAAEGAEASSDVGSTSTLREMLMSTDPSRSLDEVESPWDPERGADSRIYRGLQKATGVDGMPAIVDIVIGTAELLKGKLPEHADSDGDDGSDTGDDGGEASEILSGDSGGV